MAKINWKNSGGGDFAVGSNWSTGTVPVSSSIANINATGTYTVTSSGSPTVLAITTIPTATLDVTAGNFTALAGTGVGANAGMITVESGAIFTVGGTVKNSGIITLNGTGELALHSDTILQGGGKITLSDNLGNTGHLNIASEFSPVTLTNVDNVISGSGYIDNVSLVNQSKGVIDANGSSQLALNEEPGFTLTNAGVLESTSTGGLVLSGPINNSATGVIGAFGAGSTVSLTGDGTRVSGGTLETASGGEILVYGGVTLDGSNGHTVTNTGSVAVVAGYTVHLLGTISNTGTIALNNNSHLVVDTGGVTLAGSGNVTLSDSAGSGYNIIGNGASTTLTNQNTISGAGEIGGNGLLLTNQGVIDATGINPLIVDTGASAVTNSGTLEATNNGTLFVASNVTNTGHLIANNGTDIFAGAVSGTGTATVQGAGSIEFGSTTTSNITFAAGADGTVTFDAASTLTGKLSITGFTLGDTIDLADINFSGSGPTLTFSKGVLTVSDGTHVANLNMIGNFTLASFHAASDGSGGTLITDPPATSTHSANIAPMATYTYQTIDPPGSIYTVADSINANGQIVGYYQDSNHVQHGFLDNNGIYTTIDRPGSTNTVPSDINSLGQIVGVYGGGGGGGFLYSHGTYTTIDPPGGAINGNLYINKTGQIVGTYRDGGGVDHGFLYSNGAYTTLNYPGALDTYAGPIPSRSVIASAELGSAFQKCCAAPRSSVLRRVRGLPAGNGSKPRQCRRSLHCATVVSCWSENSATAR
jgi:probable HAF family extracellular repeat protein